MSQTAEQKKASFSEKEFLSKATPMMRSVYERWGGNPVVAEDLRKAVQNREKVMEFWRQKHEGVEAELAPYAERLADALVSAYKAGGLAAAKRAAFEFFDREKYGERKLADRLLPDASEALQHESGTMLKFSRLPLFTCPGADVCGAHCYAIHGHYANEPVKDAILRQDAFIQLLEKKLIERVGREPELLRRGEPPALAAGLVGAALAGAVEAAGGAEIVRLHDSGDFNDPVYAAAWMAAARLLPRRHFYTYTKTFPIDDSGRKIWEGAVAYYSKLFGEPPPKNFAVNLSATSTNFHVLPKAAEGFAELGIQTPGVFFYAPGNMAKYYDDEEKWRRLAEALVEAAARTTGRKLILEIEHGLGARRGAKSASNLQTVVEEVVNYAERAGVPLKVVVPTTAYMEGGAVDEEKTKSLREIAEELAGKFPHSAANEGMWAKTVKGKTAEMSRDVEVFEVPGAGEPVEVFIEPGGEKACTLCRRCVVAPHSPQRQSAAKRVTVRLGVPISVEAPLAVPAEEAAGEVKRRKKRAVAA
jgi:hypothetical protein